MAEVHFERVKKALASPHSWGRWPSEARSEGVPTFLRKVGISEYLQCKYSGSPRPSATPLINEGGKIVGSLTVLNGLPLWRKSIFLFESSRRDTTTCPQGKHHFASAKHHISPRKCITFPSGKTSLLWNQRCSICSMVWASLSQRRWASAQSPASRSCWIFVSRSFFCSSSSR